MDVLTLIGISFLTAAVSGLTMGYYLAAVNHFIPVRSLRKSLITNIVIAVSLFLPLALQREFTGDATLGMQAWFGMGIVYLTFATVADVTNFILCRRRSK